MTVFTLAVRGSTLRRHRKPLTTAQATVYTLCATVCLLLSLASLVGFFGLWFALRAQAALDYADFAFPPGLLLLLVPVVVFAALFWLLMRVILGHERASRQANPDHAVRHEPDSSGPLTPFEELLAIQN